MSARRLIIEVIDSILKDGVLGAVAPEAMMDPGGEGLQWLVSGIVGRGIQLNDSCLILTLCPRMEPSNSPIIELLDKAGELLHSIIKGDGEVGETLLVLLIPRWALCEAIVIFVHPLFKYLQLCFESLDFLPMDIISNPDGVSKSGNDGSELIRGWIRGGCEDILHRGGREGEAPRVSGCESNPSNVFGDFTDLKGIMVPKAKVAREATPVLFRGCNMHWNGQGCRGCEHGKGSFARQTHG